MVTWIVVGVVVLALVVLLLAVRPVAARMSGLSRAVHRLQRRAEEAQALQARATELERSIAEVRRRAELAQARSDVIRARRGDHGDAPAFLHR